MNASRRTAQLLQGIALLDKRAQIVGSPRRATQGQTGQNAPKEEEKLLEAARRENARLVARRDARLAVAKEEEQRTTNIIARPTTPPPSTSPSSTGESEKTEQRWRDATVRVKAWPTEPTEPTEPNNNRRADSASTEGVEGEASPLQNTTGFRNITTGNPVSSSSSFSPPSTSPSSTGKSEKTEQRWRNAIAKVKAWPTGPNNNRRADSASTEGVEGKASPLQNTTGFRNITTGNPVSSSSSFSPPSTSPSSTGDSNQEIANEPNYHELVVKKVNDWKAGILFKNKERFADAIAEHLEDRGNYKEAIQRERERQAEKAAAGIQERSQKIQVQREQKQQQLQQLQQEEQKQQQLQQEEQKQQQLQQLQQLQQEQKQQEQQQRREQREQVLPVPGSISSDPSIKPYDEKSGINIKQAPTQAVSALKENKYEKADLFISKILSEIEEEERKGVEDIFHNRETAVLGQSSRLKVQSRVNTGSTPAQGDAAERQANEEKAAAAAKEDEQKKAQGDAAKRKAEQEDAAAERKAEREKEARRIKDAMAEKDKLLKGERERKKNENKIIEKAKNEKTEKEAADQVRAKNKKDQQEKAKQQKDQEEKAEQEIAKQQKDEKEKAKQEKAKQEDTKSSISNYFMTDNVDNIEQRFRDFVKEYGKNATEQFTEDELKKIDKAVIKRAIKKLSEPSPISPPQPPAPKISIRTTNALIEVLGRTIKKEKNVKELFDSYNIKITSKELDTIFKNYFENGINKKKISSFMKSESKDNDSENVEFIVNRIAGISKDDLIKLIQTRGNDQLNEDEKKKLEEKYFKDGKFNMGKLIELYGIK